MRGRMNRRGQSILEYLIVVAAIIAAIVIFGPAMGGQVAAIGNTAVTEVRASAGVVAGQINVGRQ